MLESTVNKTASRLSHFNAKSNLCRIWVQNPDKQMTNESEIFRGKSINLPHRKAEIQECSHKLYVYKHMHTVAISTTP